MGKLWTCIGRAAGYLRVGADVEAVVEQDVFRDHVDVLYDGLAHGHVHGVARQLRDARRGGVVAGLAESLLRHSSSAFMWMRAKDES